jgi:hypothetical protein
MHIDENTHVWFHVFHCFWELSLFSILDAINRANTVVSMTKKTSRLPNTVASHPPFSPCPVTKTRVLPKAEPRDQSIAKPVYHTTKNSQTRIPHHRRLPDPYTTPSRIAQLVHQNTETCRTRIPYREEPPDPYIAPPDLTKAVNHTFSKPPHPYINLCKSAAKAVHQKHQAHQSRVENQNLAFHLSTPLLFGGSLSLHRTGKSLKITKKSMLWCALVVGCGFNGWLGGWVWRAGSVE